MGVRLLAIWCTSTSRRSARSPQAAAGVHGRNSAQARRSKRRPVGYTYIHVAIDDYSRVAYVEAHDDETAATLIRFWRRAQDWFWSNDMAVDEVLTDNGPNFCIYQAGRRPRRGGEDLGCFMLLGVGGGFCGGSGAYRGESHSGWWMTSHWASWLRVRLCIA